MKIKTIAIEEHFVLPHLIRDRSNIKQSTSEYDIGAEYAKEQSVVMPALSKKLMDLGEGRLADMDASGIDMQVLQISGYHGLNLADKDANDFVSNSNDMLARAISKHPDRFSGFAQLNLQDPERAAVELERSVTKLGLKGGLWSGKCKGHYLDHPMFHPVWEAAEKLGVPIYLHPEPPAPELAKAWYTDLPEGVAGTLAFTGWGWHIDNGFHSLRLVLSGLFDRFPKLQVIIGHMGEGIPFLLARANAWLSPRATYLERTIEEYYSANFHLTTSGFFSIPTFLCVLMVFGADRIIFAVDYPYSANEEGRKFLDTIPICHEDLEKISHKNAEKLLKL